jgi:hypothetical protein
MILILLGVMIIVSYIIIISIHFEFIKFQENHFQIQYYSLIIPTLVPVSILFIYFNWLSWKKFSYS